MAITLEKIQAAARADRIKWLYHALLRFRERGITREQAKRVIREGQIIEQYPKAKPLSKCLMMRILEDGRTLYVALAYDENADYIHVITVHWLDPEKWDDPWKRKKP